jgi:ornithine cyclodeaminase
MANPHVIAFDDVDHLLTWDMIGQAVENGHNLPKGDIADSFCRSRTDTLLTRSAWIDGLGVMVKAATIIPAAKTSVNGGVMLFNDKVGTLQAVIDFHLVTKWKTVGDSLLAAKYLARPNSTRMVIIGAGTVARHLIEAYRSLFPKLDILLWNRTIEKAERLAHEMKCRAVANLAKAASEADIVCCATMASAPVLKGSWLSKGTHVDLIGAYRPDMREADDEVITTGTLFVDSRDTTIEHIGELSDPIERGIIAPEDISADFYDLKTGAFKRRSDNEITVFKNGGGAHLDLMVANKILEVWRRQVA